MNTLLHDDSIRLYTRIAGLFVLLYAQPLARVARMRAHQITVNPDGVVTATFDTFPIELPDGMTAPLDEDTAGSAGGSKASTRASATGPPRASWT